LGPVEQVLIACEVAKVAKPRGNVPGFFVGESRTLECPLPHLTDKSVLSVFVRFWTIADIERV
jgi:hypothetical protein